MIPFIDAISDVIKTGLDKWIPDANVREQVALEVAKQAYKEVELEVQDRANARAREMAVRDSVPANLAYITVGGFLFVSMAVIGNALYWHFPIVNEALAMIGTIIGYLSAKSELALAYYFGSSRGSERKTELLNERLTH